MRMRISCGSVFLPGSGREDPFFGVCVYRWTSSTMSSVRLNAGGQCLRFVFVAWNILVFLIGAAAVAIGIWQLVDNREYETLTGDEYTSGSILSIVAGVIAMGVALLGVIGGCLLWRWALALYAIIVALFVALEIASAITGFVFRNEVEDTISDAAVEAIRENYNNTDMMVIDDFQNTFDCCGWNNYEDWLQSNYFVNISKGRFPESCECTPESDSDPSEGSSGSGSGGSGSGDSDNCFEFRDMYIYREGCRDSVIDAVRRYQLIVGIVGIVFAAIQISAIIIAMVLCCCVHRATGEYTTV